ncbi:hypothetical protein GGR51DRAFT_119953 [Nemania sp. FL0031]|nr:hypothetical protein GGR51DRAFT_119953 [Nemania sp. FL0031]
MDDPWGSPWASTDAPSDHEPPSSSRANIFLSPPPKAFFGNGSGLSAQSPWSDHDDGLGVRKPGDRADGTESQNEWSAWAEAGIQTPRLSPRLSSPSKETLAWPENAAASPVFMAKPRSRTPSIMRHHSPDPWATEFSLANRSDIELPNSLSKTSNIAPAIETRPVEESSLSYQLHIENEIEEGKTNEGLPTEEEGAIPEGAREVGESGRSRGRELVDEHTSTKSKLDPTVYDIPSRPSSACTINSDGPERQDSPITSIDEDRGARMHNNLRKTSGKVQELVGIYDGLTRAASEEPPANGRQGTSRTASREKYSERSEIEDDNDDNDDGVGFGDFEDALASNSEVAQSFSQASPSQEFSTPKVSDEGVFPRESRDEGERGYMAATETTTVQSQSMLNKFQHINFDTNLASMDKLFPEFPNSLTGDSTEGEEISDHPITDSFTTISERKAWYRISRYGSMRKHNSGDDENYHRVTWPASQLHDDTIKIVRRWMEQDSYAGKATLGGTKRTGFFDWDSDAAPVRLDEVFQRRKSVNQHTRTTSIPANNVIKTALVEQRPYRNSTGISLAAELQSVSQPTTPIPDFGWSSKTKKDSLSTVSSRESQDPNPTAVSVPVHRLAPIQTTPIEEDDDDWGEMVSSPRVAKEHADSIVSTFSLPKAPTENHRPMPQLLLSTSTVDQSAALKLSGIQATQPALSDPFLFPHVSVPDKIKHTLNRDSTGALNQGSVTRLETPRESTIADQTKINKASTASAPLEVTAATLTSTNWAENESKDDITVESILQRLPDLSYMLR